ncbi:hypothetical protein cypCar_00010663 [Cyprinus carpio]|nr:hypothetical protein cypCar_00010663 [Cyprinus carpio]
MDLTDEYYGDLDDKPFGTLHHNEDSVDIYSGLENSPKIDGHRGKVNPLLSPRTMESMDIYEDIIREEQEEKEATYNEACLVEEVIFVDLKWKVVRQTQGTV